MKFVEVDQDRFYHAMHRCGAYVGSHETGFGHCKTLYCRSLSVWQGETVVGVVSFMKEEGTTFSLAGYLDSHYE